MIINMTAKGGGTTATSPSVATATTSGTNRRNVSFTVSKEPSWFMMICADATTEPGKNRVQHMLYDGTITTTYYTRGTTVGSIVSSTSYGTFSYSSGTLTITVATVPYLATADWALYYL